MKIKITVIYYQVPIKIAKREETEMEEKKKRNKKERTGWDGIVWKEKEREGKMRGGEGEGREEKN